MSHDEEDYSLFIFFRDCELFGVISNLFLRQPVTKIFKRNQLDFFNKVLVIFSFSRKITFSLTHVHSKNSEDITQRIRRKWWLVFQFLVKMGRLVIGTFLNEMRAFFK